MQPSKNGGVAHRIQQATVVNDFIDTILALDKNARVVVVGDFNELKMVEPINMLTSNKLFDLMDKLPPEERFSYIFEGNGMAMDHIFVSESIYSASNIEVCLFLGDLYILT